ncbi:MAG: hypothetical protein ACJAVV_002949, partial [Alphaproteobacteria bacterium]
SSTVRNGGKHERYNQFFSSHSYVLKSTNFSHKIELSMTAYAVEGPVRLARLNDRSRVSHAKLMK